MGGDHNTCIYSAYVPSRPIDEDICFEPFNLLGFCHVFRVNRASLAG